MAPSPQDRRKQRRKQVNLRVDFTLGSAQGKAMTVDVSETGLFLNTPLEAADGAEIRMRIFQVPPLPEVAAGGVVRRVVRPGQGPLPGWGIEFNGAEGVDIVENLEHPQSPAGAAASPGSGSAPRPGAAAVAAEAARLIQERLARAKEISFEAEKLLHKSDFKGAYSSFKLASVLDPQNPEYQRQVKILEPRALRDGAATKFDSAKAALERGDEAAAVRLLREAVTADHKNAEARYELAKILLGGMRQADPKGQKEVRDLAARAVMLDPGKAQYQILAGRVVQLMGDAEGARMYFRTALKLDPASDAAKRALAGLDSGDKKWVG